VRELLRYHAGTTGSPQERVARARTALEKLGKYAGAGAYGALMRAEAKLLEKIPASYILGEFLAENNHAVQISDFLGAGAAHGLEFVGEADFDAEALMGLSADGVAYVDELSGIDRVRAAQELDFLSGRPFRRTLLRRRIPGATPRSPSVSSLGGLHITALLRPSSDGAASDHQTFVDRHGRRVTARTPAIEALLTQLAETYPASVSVDALLESASSDKPRVAAALLGLITSGRALVSVSPLAVGRESDVRPKVWSFARAEAAMGLPGVCSLHHVAVALPKIGALIAAKADGALTKAELAAWLTGEIAAGRAPLQENNNADRASTNGLAERHVADTLRHLAASAVLAP